MINLDAEECLGNLVTYRVQFSSSSNQLWSVSQTAVEKSGVDLSNLVLLRIPLSVYAQFQPFHFLFER
jgi:hypothetical protein